LYVSELKGDRTTSRLARGFTLSALARSAFIVMAFSVTPLCPAVLCEESALGAGTEG
jgi:hypothetical protein